MRRCAQILDISMSESKPLEWGVIARLGVMVVAAMVVAIAAKPYENDLRPYLEKMKEKGLKSVNLEAPQKKRVNELDPPVILEQASPSKRRKGSDDVTEKDRNELEEVLDKL